MRYKARLAQLSSWFWLWLWFLAGWAGWAAFVVKPNGRSGWAPWAIAKGFSGLLMALRLCWLSHGPAMAWLWLLACQDVVSGGQICCLRARIWCQEFCGLGPDGGLRVAKTQN